MATRSTDGSAPASHAMPGLDWFGEYSRAIGATPLLTASEEHAIALRVAAGDASARDHLIRANLRLVPYVAKAYTGRGLDLPDLIGEGNRGLILAVDRFDPHRLADAGTDRERPIRFGTFATWWIRQAIGRAIRDKTSLVRVPVYAGKLLNDVRQDATSLQRMPAAHRRIVGLATIAITSQTPAPILEDMSPSGEAHPGRELEREDARRLVATLLDCLTPAEREIVERYNSLRGGNKQTRKMIASEMGLSREWVRLLLDRAMRKMAVRAKQLDITYEKVAG